MSIADCIKIKNTLTDTDDQALYEQNYKELVDGGVPPEDAYKQAAELTMESVLAERNELAGMIREQGGAAKNLSIEQLLSPAPMYKRAGKSTLSRLYMAIGKLPSSFQYKTSDSASLQDITEDMGKTEWKATDDTISFLVPDEELGDWYQEALKLHDKDKRKPYVQIYAGRGFGGSQAYQMAMTWAHNNGKTLKPDPAGITAINRLRRTDAMISSMLRHGTAKHLEPHHHQYVGLLEPELYTKIHDELRNEGGTNMNPEIEDRLKEIKDMVWDENNFEKSLHNMLLNSAMIIERRLQRAQKHGVSKDDIKQSGDYGVGGATLRRYEVTRSLLSGIRNRGLDAYVWVADTPPQALLESLPLLEKRLKGIGVVAGALDTRRKKNFNRLLYSRYGKGGSEVESVQASLQKQIDKLADWVNVTVVQDSTDIPGDHPPDARGVLQNGQVYLVASQLNEGSAQAVLAHEVVGHIGLENMLGDKGYSNLLSQIKKMKRNRNRNVMKVLTEIRRNYVDEDGEYNLDPDTEAKEILAHLAEKNPKSNVIKDMWNRIKLWLSRHGWDFGKFDYDSEMVESLITQAAKHVQRPKVDPLKVSEQAAYSKEKKQKPVTQLGLYSAVEKAVLDMNLPVWRKDVIEAFGAFDDSGRAVFTATTEERVNEFIGESPSRAHLTVGPIMGTKPAKGIDIWNKIKSSPGIKKEELEWLGIEEVLVNGSNMNDGVSFPKEFTRSEVVNLVQSNTVELKETVATEEEHEGMEPIEWDNGTVWDDSEAWYYQLEDALSDFDGDKKETILGIDIGDWMEGWIDENAEKVVENYYGSLSPYQQEDLDALDLGDQVDYLINQTDADPDTEMRQEARDDFEEHASEQARESYMEVPILIYEATNIDNLIIFGNEDTGFDVRTSMMASDVVRSDIWSFDEARIQADNYAFEEGLLYESERGEDVEVKKWEDYVSPGDYENYREYKLTLPDIEEDFYEEVHFPDRNIVAFLRVNDRDLSDGSTDDDGDYNYYNTMFLDEVQSDWHSSGRKLGYIEKGVDAGELEHQAQVLHIQISSEISDKTLKLDIVERLGSHGIEVDGVPLTIGFVEEAMIELVRNRFKHEYSGITGEKYDVVIKIAEELEKADKDWLYGLSDRINEINQLEKRVKGIRYGVPEAPFKGDAWLNLALKRAIVEAVQNNYGAIAWPDGNTLQNRWSDAHDYAPQYDRKMPSIVKKLLKATPKHLVLDGTEETIGYETVFFDGFDTEEDLMETVMVDEMLWNSDDQVLKPNLEIRKMPDGSWNLLDQKKRIDGQWIVVIPDKIKSLIKGEGLPLYSRHNPPTETTHEQEIEDEALRKLGMEPQERRGLMRRLRDLKAVNWKEAMNYYGHRFNEGMFDGLAGMKYAEEHVGTGIAAGEYEDSGYVSARLATGTADMMTHILHYGALEWREGVPQGVEGSQGLLDVLGELGDQTDNFLMWMAGNRAEQLMEQGREKNLTMDEITFLKSKNSGNVKLFNDVKRKYNAMNKAMLDFAQEAGLIKPETRPEWESEWYIPFYRQDEGEIMSPHSRRGLSHQTAGIKYLAGSDRPTGDLLQNLLLNWMSLVDASVKNMALVKSVDNLALTDYLTHETPKYTKQLISKNQVAKLIKKDRDMAKLAAEFMGMEETANEMDIINSMNQLDTDGFEEFWAQTVPKDERVIRIMRDGKAQYWRVNDGYDDYLRAVKFLGRDQVGGSVMRGARFMKQLLTLGVTTSPDFMARNFIRDMVNAWAINPDKSFKLVTSSLKGLKTAVKEDELYRILMAGGASFQGGYVHGTDPEAAAQTIRRELKKRGLTRMQIDAHMSSIVDTPKKMGDMILRGWQKYRTIGDKVENSSRVATAKSALDSGKSVAQVLYESKDLMDYSLRGNFGAALFFTDIVPFLNARLQGMSKLVRAGYYNKETMIKKASMVALFSIALAAWNDDDERYQELQDWDKDAYWHFFFGDEHFRIPKPFEFGIVTATIPERMYHTWVTDSQPNEKLLWSFKHSLMETLAINPIPQAVLPILEVWGNKSYYFDTPIESFEEQRVSSREAYNEFTSELMKQLGDTGIAEAMNLSPKQLEHLWKGYTGTMGGYILGISDMMLRSVVDAPSRPETEAADLPLVKAFYSGDRARTTQRHTDFYDRLTEVEEIYNTAKLMSERGQREKLQEYRQEHGQKLAIRKQMNLFHRRIRNLKDKMQRVINSDMSPKEKRAQQQLIQKKINEASKAASDFSEKAFTD